MLSSEDYLSIFHEIKNSITLIGSSLQLVEKKHPEVKDFEYWIETMGEIDFLKNMVTELSSCRITGKLNMNNVSIESFISDITNSLRSLSWQHFFCEVSIQPDIVSAEFDSVRMKEAIANLLKNAYEAMNKSGTVHLNIYQKEQFLFFDIIDMGGGIDPQYEEHLFEPFISSKERGSGLGLLITRQIVEAHHGTLSYESRPGDGCTFTIQIPILQK